MGRPVDQLMLALIAAGGMGLTSVAEGRFVVAIGNFCEALPRAIF